MKRGDYKWIDNRSVLLLSSALEVMNDSLSVQRRKKSSKIKYSVPCPKVAKLYNSNMVEWILWTNALPQIIWIESHLLDFTSIVTSFIT